MGTWYNNDGLELKFGVTKATANTGGDFATTGPLRNMEVKVDLTTLTSSPAIVSDVTFFPKQVRIEQVEATVETAATSSSSGTIDFGLIRTDRSTEIDFNGFIAAEVKGSYDTLGKKVIYTNGVSKAGALIGTTTTNVGYLCASSTQAYQTGVVVFRVFYNAF